ncbi:MAG: hypothetical protein JKY65_07890 [Planctomycetes bacterium]|nr:hypothetical protein [Planctomycetota bacterium]
MGEPVANEALAEVEARLEREVADLRKILAADLPAHIRRCARVVFERSSQSDALNDAALQSFKQATEALANALPGEVLAPLSELGAWAWPVGTPFPEAPNTLGELPVLANALAVVEERLGALLREHGFGPEDMGDRAAYVEPAYFVGGLYLKSVVANFWRALADYDALSHEVGELASADERAARRKRWEQAP